MTWISIKYIPLRVTAPLSSLGVIRRALIRLRICSLPKIPNPDPRAGSFITVTEEDVGVTHKVRTDGHHWTSEPLLLIKESP